MKSWSRLLCVLAGFILVMGISLAVYGETEPNDTIAAANAVGLNESADGNLNSVDSTDSIDCFSFSTTEDGYFQVGVVPTSELNVEIMLKDNDGLYELGYKNDKGNGGAEGIVCPNLRAGTYYVIVKIPDAISPMKGNYTATLNFLPEEADAEPNDNVLQAAEMPLQGEVKGHIGYYGDHFTDNSDFYRITLPQDGKLELTVYPDSTGNLALGLYESVIFNNLDYKDQKGKGESEKITYPNLLAGTYIVLVNRSEGNCSYNLTSLFAANESPDNEPNDTLATAVPVTIADSASVQGKMGYYGNQYRDDNDYFQVTIPSYGKLSLEAKMDSGDGLSVGFQLWDSSLRYLGNGGVFDGLDGGIYHVRMYRNGGYGSYTATMKFEPKEAPVPVSVTATPLSPNGQVNNIPISPDNPEAWFSISLPEDGALTVSMQFPSTLYVYMGLFCDNGLDRMAGDVNAYWTTETRSIHIPNIRQGEYKVKVWRADGSGVGTVTTEFVPVTKVDEEPNDEYTSLSTIAYNQSYVGHLGYFGNGWRDTLDLYQLDIPEDGSLSVTANFSSTSYNYITLYNKDGNAYGKISENNGYWTADPRSVGKVDIKAGQYIIQISRADGYGPYDFKVDFVPNRSNDSETNGDDWSQPCEISYNEGHVGHIGYDRNFTEDNGDHYKIVLPEDGSFYATFQTDKTSYVYWRMYYSDFKTKVAESNSYWTEDLRTIGSSNLRAGTYYLSVDRADGYGTYQFYSNYDPQPIKDEEANHLASQAQSLDLNQVQQGALGYTDQYYRDTVDWYEVTVPEKARYALTLHSTNTSYYYFGLYGANRVTRYTNDNRYWTTDPYTREVDLEAGTYYVVVSRADGYGPYNVRFGTVDTPAIGCTLTGKVTTAANFPLAEIGVQVLNRTASTDGAGMYTIENVPAGLQTVTFTSGTKYYPETADVVMESGQTLTLNMIMRDSNKTAPKDVEYFFGYPAMNYMHLYWSPSVSPDVADGGGYKLYINNDAPIDLKNVLYYRNLGFSNGSYTLRLTVYDKYGNESAGNTITLDLTGEVIEPTPTPTLKPGQPTPTRTPTLKPGEPTPTPTPTSPIQPTPTHGEVYPTPTPEQPVMVQPNYIFEFDQASLGDDGWTEIPGGFTGATAGVVIPYYGFPTGKFPSSADQLGLAVAVKPGEVTFLRVTQEINTGGYPVLIRCNVRSAAANAAVAVGALKGSLNTGENLDGTIGYCNIFSAASFVDQDGRITAIFRPDSGDIISPFVQVAGSTGSAVTVWIDRVDIFILYPDMAFPGYIFGNVGFDQLVVKRNSR